VNGGKISIDWSDDDRRTIASAGMAPEEIERQLEIFRTGASPIRLLKPCTAADGIVVISEEARSALVSASEKARQDGKMMKFVPASGAASRMFREWHTAFSNGKFANSGDAESFGRSIRQYAFYSDLERIIAATGSSLAQMIEDKRYSEIIGAVLAENGLNYENSPKALLKFHKYPEGARTAIDEHLVEAALYVRDANRIARVHFTVSGDHEKRVRDRLLQTIGDYENRFDTVFDFDISVQDPATNTIAVDLEGRPFRDERGKLLFRPSGHGALLANLESLDAEIVFIKNIDNVVCDRYRDDSVFWKKLLAGYLLSVQKEIFRHLLVLDNPSPVGAEIPGMADFCRTILNIDLPADFGALPEDEKRHFLFHKLNRPLRVCGMVKNEGEPGGGPFWVETPAGSGVSSLQIVEEAQIDANDPEQAAIWSSSTHFNPVDLVCGLRDYRGREFNLSDFVDPHTSIIARKSEKGKDIIALERPGLWNGSMAFWNTIFIEVPPTTFAPVKSVKDLLRTPHQQ
jgi:hypothetical protein